VAKELLKAQIMEAKRTRQDVERKSIWLKEDTKI
jgi:hypothetical protein